MLKESIPNDTLRLLCAMAGGGVLAGLVGFVIGIPVLRLRGDYLAIVTLAFGEIMKNIIGNTYAGIDEDGFHLAVSTTKMKMAAGGKYILNGPLGATGVQKLATFTMGFVLVLITLFVVLNLINSKEGRAIKALRDNRIAAESVGINVTAFRMKAFVVVLNLINSKEGRAIKALRDNRIAAESVGINVTAFRMKAFVVSAFLAGMAGALFGLNYSSITASKFNFNTSINILVFVVLGGMGNILGSVISAALLYVLPEALRGLQDYRMILYAVVLILVMLCTWSPKVQEAIAMFTDKVMGLFKKKTKEVGSHE